MSCRHGTSCVQNHFNRDIEGVTDAVRLNGQQGTFSSSDFVPQLQHRPIPTLPTIPVDLFQKLLAISLQAHKQREDAYHELSVVTHEQYDVDDDELGDSILAEQGEYDDDLDDELPEPTLANLGLFRRRAERVTDSSLTCHFIPNVGIECYPREDVSTRTDSAPLDSAGNSEEFNFEEWDDVTEAQDVQRRPCHDQNVRSKHTLQQLLPTIVNIFTDRNLEAQSGASSSLSRAEDSSHVVHSLVGGSQPLEGVLPGRLDAPAQHGTVRVEVVHIPQAALIGLVGVPCIVIMITAILWLTLILWLGYCCIATCVRYWCGTSHAFCVEDTEHSEQRWPFASKAGGMHTHLCEDECLAVPHAVRLCEEQYSDISSAYLKA
jgi:hypothetical protein